MQSCSLCALSDCMMSHTCTFTLMIRRDVRVIMLAQSAHLSAAPNGRYASLISFAYELRGVPVPARWCLMPRQTGLARLGCEGPASADSRARCSCSRADMGAPLALPSHSETTCAATSPSLCESSPAHPARTMGMLDSVRRFPSSAIMWRELAEARHMYLLNARPARYEAMR